MGISNVKLEINSIGDPAERRTHREKLIEYFTAHQHRLDEDAQRRLYTNPLRILDTKNPTMQELVNAAPKLVDFLGEASLLHFEGLQRLLSQQGLSFTINPRLVRGMDYYNRSVFEWVSSALGSPLTIAGGGRYDGLFEQLGGKSTPACGFGIGNERAMLLLQAENLCPLPLLPDVYIVHSDTEEFANRVAELMRDTGKRVISNAGGGSFKSQMKKADVSGAKYALIIGTQEIEKGGVMLKPLRYEQEQRFIALADLASAIL